MHPVFNVSEVRYISVDNEEQTEIVISTIELPITPLNPSCNLHSPQVCDLTLFHAYKCFLLKFISAISVINNPHIPAYKMHSGL